MIQQRLVTFRELPPLRQVVDGSTHPIAAVPLGHAAQLSQGVLQTFAQALETLGKTERHRLPVRVGQHQVIDHVVERLSADGHLQAVHAREVRGAQPTRMMHLAEVHFLAWALRRPPVFDAPLQRPQLALVKPPGILLLEPAPERFGLEPRRLGQLLGHFRPNLGKRVRPGAPIPGRFELFAGKPLHVPIPPCRFPIDARLLGRTAQ
jgi:hypothetical protein